MTILPLPHLRQKTLAKLSLGLLCLNPPFITSLLYEEDHASSTAIASFKNNKASQEKMMNLKCQVGDFSTELHQNFFSREYFYVAPAACASLISSSRSNFENSLDYVTKHHKDVP
jgi:hypothetical protein